MPQSSIDLWIRNANAEHGFDEALDENGNQDYYASYVNEMPPECHSLANDGIDPALDGASVGLSHDKESCSDSISDNLVLAHFCSLAHPPMNDSDEQLQSADASWDAVRTWMRTHNVTEVQTAVVQRDASGKTALHFACQNAPPEDVMDVFFSISSDVVQWPDNFGWLPIHYACAYAASTYVIKGLAEIFPESKTAVDRKGRTPLHFALGNSHVYSADIVMILSSSGAASYRDDNGMLPLHYACAYGASEDCLFVLTNVYVDGISCMDERGRTPLHFTLSNSGRPAAASAVRLLLGLNRDLVNAREGSPLPLKVLAEYATTVLVDQERERDSCKACLRHLLAAHPIPTPDFFTALESLPDFLKEMAVVMKVVQQLLNYKIAQRFCTLILILDLYVQILVIYCYSIAIVESVDRRFNANPSDSKIGRSYLYPLYAGATYFFLREVINLLSLLSLGALGSWAYEPSSWLNILYVFAVYFWTFHMAQGSLDNDVFRNGAAVSIIILSTKFLSYLRNMMIDFAVFTGGVFHVMRRLAAFLLCLVIILVAFSRMFFTLYQQSGDCLNNSKNALTESEVIQDLQCEIYENQPWCNGWDAFLAVYTMLLGEVDETQFEGNPIATFLFAMFMFLVVILLANVLIAVVTDSYKVIQDQRAAIVFWTNRLHFIAQMDAIANGPWKKFLRKLFGLKKRSKGNQALGLTNVFGKEQWTRLMDLFEDEFDGTMFSIEYLMIVLLRMSASILIIPAWFLFGIITLGWLWPPQIREYLFMSAVARHDSESSKEEALRRTQLLKVKEELIVMGEELRQELALDRTQIVQTKSLVAERKLELAAEMKQIKRIIEMLFEQRGDM